MKLWYHPSERVKHLGTAMSSGLLLAAAFPPIPTGITAFVAFVPLLSLLETRTRFRQVFASSYVAFLFLHIGATWWISGWGGEDPWLVVAGIAVNLFHPLLFTLPMLALRLVWNKRGRGIALCCLPFLWVAYEYVFHLPELSFPWLLVGNTQTYNIHGMQIASITGVFGLSFWILTVNVLLYHLFRRWKEGKGMPWTSRLLGPGLAIILLPHFYTMIFVDFEMPAERTLTVAVVQPDIDPYAKWGRGTPPRDMIDHLLFSYDSVARVAHPDLLLLPETALPFRVLQPSYGMEWDYLRARVDSARVPILIGFPDLVWYFEPPYPRGARRVPDTEYRYNDFNSTMLVQPGIAEVQKYHKSRLTPMSERIPYIEYLPFLEEAFSWGVGISNWGVGRDTSVFRLSTPRGQVPFWSMICYETLYPSFVSEFVHRGAAFLTVVTNDGWFGRSSGPYQLQQFAALRAVENHRAIARCANNGISCLIDPYGRVSGRTALFSQATALYSVPLRSDLTFYTRHGDWFAELITGLAVIFLVLSILKTRNFHHELLPSRHRSS